MTPPGRPRHWLEYKYLLAWLQVATKGLSDESRARVREEITDHFHQAVDDGLRAGLTEDRAAEQAVTSLGSPKAARRAFRRTYLTRYQAKIVRDLVEPATRVLFLYAYMVAAAAFLTVLFPRPTGPGWYIRAGMVTLIAVAAVILATAVPRLYRRGQQRAAIALGAGVSGLLWLLWGALLVGGDLSSEERRWFPLAVLAWMAVNYLPLLPKFGKQRPRST
jgi:hypothetical protein